MPASQYQGLHNLVAPRNARKKPKRLGRGESSGHGKTSGRGNKGQKARKSGNVRIGFEGGQAQFARRVPKRGFCNSPFAKEMAVVNLMSIDRHFEPGALVEPGSLVAAGLLSSLNKKVKVLGTGDVQNSLTVRVHAISQSAQQKIEAKGGKVELIREGQSQ